jgi:hypothetical protein
VGTSGYHGLVTKLRLKPPSKTSLGGGGESSLLGDPGSSVTPQERQRPLIEFLDALVKRRVRTPVPAEKSVLVAGVDSSISSMSAPVGL